MDMLGWLEAKCACGIRCHALSYSVVGLGPWQVVLLFEPAPTNLMEVKETYWNPNMHMFVVTLS